MRDFDQILALWADAERKEQAAVLATVVKTRGSSYRLPGARLLLTRNGRRAGAVSGGCLEDDLIKRAWWLTESGPIVRRYDTTPDDELGTGGYGLGCNGVIYVLLERLTPGNAPALPLFQQVEAGRRPAVIAHWIAPAAAAGKRAVLDSGDPLSPDLEALMRTALAEQASHTALLSDGAEVFIETLVPSVRLLVFGAGDDAVPLVKLAKFLRWQVTVLDGRAHYARREKFPEADEVIVRSRGEELARMDPWTAAVIMTHSYSQDLDILRELWPMQLPYLGVLGPRKRTERLLEEAGLSGVTAGSVLHSPMGLDIGADGAEQVALAVIAEIQATLNGRNGGQLRERTGSIHARETIEDDESVWVRSIVCA